MREHRRTRIILTALLVASFTLITLDLGGQGGSIPRSIRSGIESVVSPIQSAVAGAWRPIGGFFGRVTGDDQDRIDELQRQVDALKLQLATTEDARRRAAELDDLLRIAGLGQYRVVLAQVISRSAGQQFSNTLLIDAGSRDGITPDMTVINGDGLVGRVTAVTRTTATVVLLIDPDSYVGVRAESTGSTAYVQGQGLGKPLLLTADGQDRTLVPGTRLVTQGSPSNRPYVAGVPVGEIIEIQSAPGQAYRQAIVQPYVDPDSIDLVSVVIEAPREDPRDAVLPPRPPTPTPTPSPTPTTSPSASAGSESQSSESASGDGG